MPRRIALAVLTAALLISAPAAAETPPPALGADALWVWSWDDQDELGDYAVANGFDRLYLYSEGFGPRAETAIGTLAGRGLAVEALGGEKRWATDHRDGMLEFVAEARDYQRSAPPAERLAGIHVDVEPYGLKAWKRDERGTALSLVRSLRAARRAAGPLPFAADVPFWFDGIRLGGGRGSLAAAAIAATDAVTLMAYRDTGPAVIDVARAEVRLAGRVGERATVGVETGEVRPEQVTFAEEGRAALIVAIAAVRTAFDGDPGFGGIAIHHYGSISELGP